MNESRERTIRWTSEVRWSNFIKLQVDLVKNKTPPAHPETITPYSITNQPSSSALFREAVVVIGVFRIS